MPLSLFHLLYVSPTERLHALQQDRQELFLLMGIAIGLLVLAFVLLVVVVFRKQKSKKEALAFQPPSENPLTEEVKEEHHSPNKPIAQTESESSSNSSSSAELSVQEEQPASQPQKSTDTQDEDHQRSTESIPGTQDEPSNSSEPDLAEDQNNQTVKSDASQEFPPKPKSAAESKPESSGNLSSKEVGQKVEDALKGAKSAEENRQAIQAYIEELRQRKANSTQGLQSHSPVSDQATANNQVPLPNETQANDDDAKNIADLEEPGSDSIESPEPQAPDLDSAPEQEPQIVALIPPFVPIEADPLPTPAPQSLSEQDESIDTPSFEVEWDSVQEEQPAVRYLPAAPGDLKSFADWLKEFKRP